jgi:hypothetical protein
VALNPVGLGSAIGRRYLACEMAESNRLWRCRMRFGLRLGFFGRKLRQPNQPAGRSSPRLGEFVASGLPRDARARSRRHSRSTVSGISTLTASTSPDVD